MNSNRIFFEKTKIGIIVLGTIFQFSVSQIYAQTDGSIGNEQVDVVKEFNPLIQDANKIVFPPEPVEAKPDPISLQYNLPDRLLPLVYPQSNLKPLAIAKEKQAQYFNSYARLGFGSQWSPLGEVFFAEGKPEKSLFGAHAKYRSAHGQKIKSQDYTNIDVTGFAQTYIKQSLLKTSASFHNNTVHYYGYDVFRKDYEFILPELNQKDLKQAFNQVDVTVDLLNAKRRNSNFDYAAKVNYNYLWDKFNLNEQFINADITLKKSFKDKHHISLQLVDDFSIFKDAAGNKLNRNIFSAKAKYHFISGDWNLFGAVNPVWEAGIFHLFPDIGLQRGIYDEYIVLYNGWKMDLRKNSYASLTQQNPWLEQLTVNDFRNGWLEERFMGLKGTIKKFNYNVRFAQNLYRHMPVFINQTSVVPTATNDTVLYARPDFAVAYDRKTNILNLHAELGYRVNTNLQFNFVFNFNNFEADVVNRIYHQPRFMGNFNTRYTIAEKVILQLDIIGLDGVYYIDYPKPNELRAPVDAKLKGTIDANLGATYIFSKRFSFFAQLNNLASIKYQRFYLYQSYGFNALGGVTLHF